MVKIAIAGVCGKMGTMIANLCLKDQAVSIVSAFEAEGHPMVGKDLGEYLAAGKHIFKITQDADEALKGADCLIDFTLPGPTLEHLEHVLKNKVAVVIGTTGIGSEGEGKIIEASREVPVVFSPNMAPGVNLLFHIVSKSAGVLKGFEIKVDETHHVHKKDSPSGTAKEIGRVIKEACGREVPIEAFREGEVVGNHGIIFDNEFETLEIRHNAKTREVFASGAIKAAKYIYNKKSGRYNMADVLGIR